MRQRTEAQKLREHELYLEKRVANLEAFRKRDREYKRQERIDHPEKVHKRDREKDQRFKARDPDGYRARNRRRAGLPEPTRPCPDLCEAVGCTNPASALDHDHTTGAFRGWLCPMCNIVLGCAKDDPLRLEALADYLRKL